MSQEKRREFQIHIWWSEFPAALCTATLRQFHTSDLPQLWTIFSSALLSGVFSLYKVLHIWSNVLHSIVCVYHSHALHLSDQSCRLCCKPYCALVYEHSETNRQWKQNLIHWHSIERIHLRRPNSPLRKAHLNSLDLDFYLDPHQITHINEYPSHEHEWFVFIKIHELASEKNLWQCCKAQYFTTLKKNKKKQLCDLISNRLTEKCRRKHNHNAGDH